MTVFLAFYPGIDFVFSFDVPSITYSFSPCWIGFLLKVSDGMRGTDEFDDRWHMLTTFDEYYFILYDKDVHKDCLVVNALFYGTLKWEFCDNVLLFLL